MDEPPVVAPRGPTLVHRDMRIDGTRGPGVVVVAVSVDGLTRTMRVDRTGRRGLGARLEGL